MYTDLFDYYLPDELIAHAPLAKRDDSRLLCVNRHESTFADRHFFDLVNLLDSNSVLVLNDTKVFPARLFATKPTGGIVETLLIRQVGLDSYTALGRGKLKIGLKLTYDKSFEAIVVDKDDTGIITLKFNLSGIDLINQIYLLGQTPIPPYIESQATETELRSIYQTVYADKVGSVAAPTAGLHFTDKLLDDLKDKGVAIHKVSLHVGLGTFRPVTEDQLDSKTLHQEFIEITSDVAEALNQAKTQQKRIVAVGTTTARTLESMVDSNGFLQPGSKDTNLFITPGTQFRFIDGLITNFHLPKSSLLMLVSAFVTKPNTMYSFVDFDHTIVGQAYKHAVGEKYRFFSFGDAMYIS